MTLFRLIGRTFYGASAVFALGGLYALAKGDLGVGVLVLICAALTAMLAEGTLYTDKRPQRDP